jgi:hypothetical protein
MTDDLPKEAREYLRQIGKLGAKKGAEARWAGHKKMTEEERKAKKAEYQREYRKRNKK